MISLTSLNTVCSSSKRSQIKTSDCGKKRGVGGTESKCASALRLIYNDGELTFDREYWRITNKKSIHQRNIESLATGIYKFQADLTPLITSDLFVTRENNYNFRNFQELES